MGNEMNALAVLSLSYFCYFGLLPFCTKNESTIFKKVKVRVRMAPSSFLPCLPSFSFFSVLFFISLFILTALVFFSLLFCLTVERRKKKDETKEACLSGVFWFGERTIAPSLPWFLFFVLSTFSYPCFGPLFHKLFCFGSQNLFFNVSLQRNKILVLPKSKTMRPGVSLDDD